LLGWALLNCLMQTLIVDWRIVEDSESLKLCWLYPVQDLIGFFIWCVSFLGSEIVWRNERYRLSTGGKMERLKNTNVL
jgi:ceramide glucosyltransferase